MDKECDKECEEKEYEEICRQTFINIGMEIAALSVDLHAIMVPVFLEMIALHGGRVLKSVKTNVLETCKRTNSDIFSLSSDETDDIVLKYYISSDDEDYAFDPELI